MPVAGAVSGELDIRLPVTPELVVDANTYKELQRVYQALRSIQAFCQYYHGNHPTVSAPPWSVGHMYFDTTLNKLRVGGVVGWETVQSI